ncbi:MAG: glutamine synthetase [Rhodospirillales bacterium]|nr:glutamine synthetase [Rhodospirillales bacterium]
MGRDGFAERFGLWTAEQQKAAADIEKQVKDLGLEAVRISFADQHGILRGKTVMASEIGSALSNGVGMVTTLLAKDTSHKTVFPWFTEGGGLGMEEMTGGGDFLMMPDPSTFRVLPWAHKTGWLLADIYFPNGKPVPFSTRQILRDALSELKEAGYDYVSGLEVEFHLFKLEDPKLRPEQAGQPAEAPSVSLLAHGFQYLTEQRMDELDPHLDILRSHLLQVGLPLRTIEVEFGPSQVEITFNPGVGLETADAMILFRSAVKQIAHRQGLHATFMCRPNLPNLFSSGWHLHQSLIDRKTGNNVFVPEDDGEVLSPLGHQFIAGLLKHARGAALFSTPTINGYKRYQPYSLAPDRALWGKDNRGAMLRVIGGPGDAGSRIENRVGEPAANPYLYLASQIYSGLDGIKNQLQPSTPVDAPYDTEAPPLPRSLLDATFALKEDPYFREKFGDQFIDYLLHIKEAEITRFLTTVTDWEQREYFEIF